MEDLQAVLAGMPPGADLFDYLSALIDEQVYPDLGRTFYIQCYIVVALCSLVMLLIMMGLYIRWRKKRLNFLVMDGSATRPNLKVFVPILWWITGLSIIVHTFCLRSAMRSKHLPQPLGRFWWMISTGITCSYAVISTSTMCSAPAVRKGLLWLDRRHRSYRGFTPSFIVLNGSLIIICIAIIGPSYTPGRLTGLGFHYANEGHAAAMAVIAKAKSQQSIALLMNLPDATAILEKASGYDRRSKLVGGALHTSYIIVFFLTGLIPALFLNRYMRKRIVRLEQDIHSASMPSISFERDTMHPHLTPKSPGAPSGSSDEVDTLKLGDAKMNTGNQILPKDRPFTNLASSAEMPPVYAAIFEANINPRDTALRLRAALRRDNLQLVAYLLMLASMASLALFQLCGGSIDYDTKERFVSAYSWEAWSYLLPAMILAGSALHDAINNNNDDKEVVDLQVASFSSRKFNAPPIASIQLSQTVEVVEEYHMESKKVGWRQNAFADSHDC